MYNFSRDLNSQTYAGVFYNFCKANRFISIFEVFEDHELYKNKAF